MRACESWVIKVSTNFKGNKKMFWKLKGVRRTREKKCEH